MAEAVDRVKQAFDATDHDLPPNIA